MKKTVLLIKSDAALLRVDNDGCRTHHLGSVERALKGIYEEELAEVFPAFAFVDSQSTDQCGWHGWVLRKLLAVFLRKLS